MLENPIINSEYKGPTAYKIRDEHPEKFLKDPNIYIKGFKHEKDRIKVRYQILLLTMIIYCIRQVSLGVA
jgi:hypothetical protein